MQNWRWDQGRLTYFRFDNIKNVAKCLVPLDGASLRTGDPDPLRSDLTTQTGLPFLPTHYKVWRNYRRVLECSLLAASVNNTLAVTDICRRIAATDTFDVDEYLTFLIPRFYHPFPAFDDYHPTAKQYFPFCAVLKYLLASHEVGGEQSIALNDVISIVLGNDCDGTEPLAHYRALQPTGYTAQGDERRQIREALIFISQSSFLLWHKDRLYLDVLKGDMESARAVGKMLEPVVRPRGVDRDAEILLLGKDSGSLAVMPLITARQEPSDVIFTEGKRVRAMHLRTERSRSLRNAFFKQLAKPFVCDMCSSNLKQVYPWTDEMLEIHHLLPLASALEITGKGTSLQDVVALCPNCHKSVHVYYKEWLNRRIQDDFRTRQEAHSVYQEAKGQIQL